jgi:serine/threonine protein kinase
VADQLVIGGQLGSYLIDSVIGRGGMSVVYRAKHLRLGMWVAIKVLAPELGADDAFRERFLREAQMAATVDHPNVIPIHDMGVHESSLYIVMRYVSGGDLKALLAESGPLAPDRALALLKPIASALDAAHVNGLVHRDVKPANVLIQRSQTGAVEHVYLTDFGIAKSSAATPGLTGTGMFIGTIEYMAPEQLESREVGPQTDVYALGATFYQCLTGRIPFERELSEGARPPTGPLDPVATLRPGLPQALDGVFARALARDAADRYRTCGEFLDACEEAAAGAVIAPAVAATELSEEPQPAPAAQLPVAGDEEAGAGTDARRGRSGRGRWYAVLAAALLAAAAAAAVVILSSSKSTPSGKLSSSVLATVPTNRVTGSGQVSIRLSGDKATVTLTTEGLDKGAPLVHAMHIHAGGKGQCPPASSARLHNGHLAIDTNDGIDYYGPPVQSLTTSGDTSVASILVFPRYPTGGSIRYSRTITLPPKVVNFIRENDAVIVVHGIDYDGSGIYSGVLDRSDLDKALPATATAPALCGRLVGAQEVASHSAPALYTASLAKSSLSISELLVCQVSEELATAETRRTAAARRPAARASA